MRQKRYMMSTLPVASACLSKLWILCISDILDRDLCNIIFISIFLFFFWFSNMILSASLILPVSQLQTQQVMTSQIRSHIEYLIRTYYILFAHFVVKIYEKNVALMSVFKTI